MSQNGSFRKKKRLLNLPATALLVLSLLLVSRSVCPAFADDGTVPDPSLNPGAYTPQPINGNSATQYGSVEQEDMTRPTSFRLKRPAVQRTSPQVNEPPETFPGVVNPELNQLFPAQPNIDNNATAPAQTNNMWHPGVILTGATGQQALNPTCDLSLAGQQAAEYPTSPEAAFIYAVDLTKTSQVQQALKEVRRARNLAQATGDPNYFSRAVGQYEQTLAAEPENECIRYSLGWAYYMQAYLFAERARKEAQQQAILAGQAPARKKSKLNNDLFGGASILASVLTGTRPDASVVPHIPGALENTPEWAQPQIKIFYQKCLVALDTVVKHTPKDAWAAVYGAHVREEFDGDHQAALTRLALLKKEHPDNPAAAFFLADAYARSGNIVAGASSLSQAMGLHLQGK